MVEALSSPWMCIKVIKIAQRLSSKDRFPESERSLQPNKMILQDTKTRDNESFYSIILNNGMFHGFH